MLGRKLALGWLLVIAGCVAALNIFSRALEQMLGRFLGIGFTFSGMVIPIILIVAGVYLLQQGRK